MPQTIEHLRIMELMGISHGIIAITKTDLVTEDHLKKSIADTGKFLRGTFLENAPVCPVSSVTFDGYPEFYNTLTGEVRKLEKKRRFGIFRMPVEQVFSSKGLGNVVMGIPIEGECLKSMTVWKLFPGAEQVMCGVYSSLCVIHVAVNMASVLRSIYPISTRLRLFGVRLLAFRDILRRRGQFMCGFL